jgi:type IV pilus assembly protein PilM
LGSLLSIDIGKKNLHIVEGKFKKNNVMVGRMASFQIPKGVFQGEAIFSPKLLTETISKAARSFSSKSAVITIDAFGTIVRDVDLPSGKPREIAEIIKNEMIQAFHIDSGDVIQYKKIGKVTEEDAVLDRYRVAALNQEWVHSYYNVLSDTKLKPRAMDININAVDKLFDGDVIINKKPLKDAGTMLIDFGHTITTVYIISKGQPFFFRQLETGCGEIESLISANTFQTAEDIRKMKEEGFNFFRVDEDAAKYYDLFSPFLYNLMDEIRKVIGFYVSRYRGAVQQIYLFGGGSNLVGFSQYCENNFGVPTEQIVSLSNVKIKSPATSIAPYVNAIGGLIRYEGRK